MKSPETINLERVRFLLVDGSGASLSITAAALNAFGARNVGRARSLADARRLLSVENFDFLILSPTMPDGDGFEFAAWVRHAAIEANRFIPMIVISAHTRQGQVVKARDSGVQAVISKPLSPKTLLDRILWIVQDQRSFVEAGGYIGPDRRSRSLGPPHGKRGRRGEDSSK